MSATETILALGFTLAGISGIVGALSVWCRPVKFTQLTRYQGPDKALRSYEQRRDAGGFGARVRA
jgi:hypothetical protein